MAEEVVMQAVGQAAYTIAFITALVTALFYIYAFGYLAGYNRELKLPMAFRDISFLSILSIGNGAAQLAIIILVIVFPLVLIYKDPNEHMWIIVLITAFILFWVVILKYFVKNGYLKNVNMDWIGGYLLKVIQMSFLIYSALFILSCLFPISVNYGIDKIRGYAELLSTHHYIYITIIIIFSIIILSHYLGAKQAKRNMDLIEKSGDYRIEICMKNGEHYSESNGPYFLLAYTNGNYIICNKEIGQDKQEIILIPNANVRKAILYRPNIPSTNDNRK